MFENFMNPPEVESDYNEEKTISKLKQPTRDEIIINNILSEICGKLDMSPEEYDKWLRIEIGMTGDDISRLKEVGCFPEIAA